MGGPMVGRQYLYNAYGTLNASVSWVRYGFRPTFPPPSYCPFGVVIRLGHCVAGRVGGMVWCVW